jgi:hypothetical protein
MEKISIAVGFKDGIPEILKEGKVDEVLAAYREAELDDSFDFVGMLRKPVWYKRNTPKINKEREAERRKQAERNEVETSGIESAQALSESESQAKAAAQAAKDEDDRAAERFKEQSELNARIAKMEAADRAAFEAEEDERSLATAESIVDVAPSAEEEARAAVVAQSAPKKKKS